MFIKIRKYYVYFCLFLNDLSKSTDHHKILHYSLSGSKNFANKLFYSRIFQIEHFRIWCGYNKKALKT